MEESAGVIEAFSLRWFSLCLFLTVLHSVYYVVVMLLKSCFSGAEIYFCHCFRLLSQLTFDIKIIVLWLINSLPGYAGRSGIQMNSCYLSTTLLGRIVVRFLALLRQHIGRLRSVISINIFQGGNSFYVMNWLFPLIGICDQKQQGR